MTRPLTIASTLLLVVTTAAALPRRARGVDAPSPPTSTSLTIEGFELAESRFGPAKLAPTYIAGERLCVRLLARGLTADAEGRLSLGVGIALDRAERDVAPFETIGAPDVFAARALPVAVSFPIGGGATAGPHTLVLVLEDRTTGERRARTEKIEIRAPATLTALNPYFAADADGEVERPAEFRTGETIRLLFGVVGLKPAGGRVRVEGDLEVRDVASGATVSRRARVLALEGGVTSGLPALDAALATTATRAGRFLLRVTVRDLNTSKEAVIEREVSVRP